MTKIPSKGDIVWVNFTPQSGHEQKGHRQAVVVSPKLYNENSSMVVVCPITSNISSWPWKVMLPDNSEVKGAVLVDQVRSIDRVTRKVKIVGAASQDVMAEVSAKLAALLDMGF